MADWTLAPSLQQLFTEFNIIAPTRDHDSDGSIGNAAHQQTVSDHNPDSHGVVHAIDVDKDLRADFTMEEIVQYHLSECRKPNSIGLDRGRLTYIIYNRRIWSASSNWVQKPYTGPNPHDKHAHFSCEYDLKYANDTRTWGLIEKFGDLPMDQATYNKMQIASLKDENVQNAFRDMFLKSMQEIMIEDYADPDDVNRKLAWTAWIGYSDARADVGRVEDMVTEILTLLKGAKK